MDEYAAHLDMLLLLKPTYWDSYKLWHSLAFLTSSMVFAKYFIFYSISICVTTILVPHLIYYLSLVSPWLPHMRSTCGLQCWVRHTSIYNPHPHDDRVCRNQNGFNRSAFVSRQKCDCDDDGMVDLFPITILVGRLTTPIQVHVIRFVFIEITQVNLKWTLFNPLRLEK